MPKCEAISSLRFTPVLFLGAGLSGKSHTAEKWRPVPKGPIERRTAGRILSRCMRPGTAVQRRAPRSMTAFRLCPDQGNPTALRECLQHCSSFAPRLIGAAYHIAA